MPTMTGETTSGTSGVPPSNSLYQLQRHDVGVVHIDNQFRVTAMNRFARRVLPVDQLQPFQQSVLAFHPKRSQAKVQFLLEQADYPIDNPPPMTMLINIPERVLMINVTRLIDVNGESSGYTLVFYDITDEVSHSAIDADAPTGSTTERGATGSADGTIAAGGKRRLAKIPTVVNHRIVLVDAAETFYIRAEGHYTWIHTATGANFCNLNIGDLEERLDGASFLRIHRSYLANLVHADQILREDGRVRLKQRHINEPLPVARTIVPTLMRRLGIG